MRNKRTGQQYGLIKLDWSQDVPNVLPWLQGPRCSWRADQAVLAPQVSGHPAIAPHLEKFYGIRNGIDQEIWDPLFDRFLPRSGSPTLSVPH